MHLAVECSKAKAIEFLIEKGANPHIEDFYQEDVCEKIQKKHNLTLSDNTMMAFLQCRPDKRIKLDMAKVQEEHKEEENKFGNDDESSNDGNEADEQNDKESLMAFEKQSSSSESETSENTEMMMTGSSFWVSDMGAITPSLNKYISEDTYNSEKFMQNLREDEQNDNSETKNDNKPTIVTREEKRANYAAKMIGNSVGGEKFFSVVVEASEKSIEGQGGSGQNFGTKDPDTLLSPAKNPDPLVSQPSFQSQVSNNFKINVLQEDEANDYSAKKSRNSALKASVEKKKQEAQDDEQDNDPAEKPSNENVNLNGFDNTADTAPNETAEGEQDKTIKKKKKKKKVKKQAVEDNQQPEEQTAELEEPAVEPEQPNEEPEEAPVVENTPVEEKQEIKLRGLEISNNPINLDKLLLENQFEAPLK